MDLFGTTKTFEDFLLDLEQLSKQVVDDNELPTMGVMVRRNIGKGKDNTGDLISCTICINEPPYPLPKHGMAMKDMIYTQSPIITIQAPKKNGESIEFTVDSYTISAIPVSSDMELLAKNSQDEEFDKQRIRANMSSGDLLPWIKKLVDYRISKYVSSASSFGCCDMFEKCSDAKKCIHENRLYSTACAYRHNLESGRIFYGKNRNI